MIPNNVIQRTFHIMVGEATGTCFTLDVEGKQYIITAKHIVEKIEKIETIGIYHDNQWKNIDVSLVGHAHGSIDISVLATDFQLSLVYQVEPISESGGLYYGQDVYFLGFPYGMTIDLENLNMDFPLPFVKKGILSCIVANKNKEQLLYLDGHNNPGFSGGPVVFKLQNENEFRIASVISGYRYTEEPVYQGDTPVPLAYRYNTGIIISYGIIHAIDLIKANPIGFKL